MDWKRVIDFVSIIADKMKLYVVFLSGPKIRHLADSPSARMYVSADTALQCGGPVYDK